MNFFESEEGAIVSYVVHELCNSNALVSGTVHNLLKSINNGLSTAEIISRLERIGAFTKRNNDASDYLYNKFKERFNDK